MVALNVMIGVPGCGKSTFAESGEIPGVVLSSDKIRKMYWSETDQSHNAEVFDILKETAASLLDDGKDVIIDATNVKPDWRQWCIDMAHDKGAECRAYSFEHVSVDTCLERNRNRARQVPDDVIRHYADMLVTPTKDEGFDAVEFVGVEPERDKVNTALLSETESQAEHGVEMG